MNKKQITHITNKLYRDLKKHLKKFAEDFDGETIHKTDKTIIIGFV